MENILKELEERGLIKDYSNREAVEKLLNTKQTIYCGFDPTNKSLHIGNFLMIITLMKMVVIILHLTQHQLIATQQLTKHITRLKTCLFVAITLPYLSRISPRGAEVVIYLVF